MKVETPATPAASPRTFNPLEENRLRSHYRFLTMKLARQLERRLEDALDGLAGRIFRGGLQVPELTARLAREAELAEFKTPAGPATANHFRLLINPSNLGGGSDRVSSELSAAFAAHAAERGWRLEGPVTVTIGPSPAVGVGSVTCEADGGSPGPLSTWATLTGSNGQAVEIRPNRALIGRSQDADVVIDAPEVSRLHALIYRQDGEAFVVDLASANGTEIDGNASQTNTHPSSRRIGADPGPPRLPLPVVMRAVCSDVRCAFARCLRRPFELALASCPTDPCPN